MLFKKDIEKKLMISEIEGLTEETIKPYILETMTIKDHNCYFCYFGEYFGYSIAVFKNGKHIHYANDYELHNHWLVKEKGYKELRKYYIEKMENKLFTDAELLEPCCSYAEYERKNHFLRNYWNMRYNHMSMFFIGSNSEREERQKIIDKNYPYFSWVCFSYFQRPDIVDAAKKYYNVLEESFTRLKDDNNVFREMVKKELANHEACLTCDYTEALNALNLTFEELTKDKKKIVKEELKKQIQSYCY